MPPMSTVQSLKDSGLKATLPRRKNADADAALKWIELFLQGTRKR